MEQSRYQGEITTAKTTKDKVLDIINAIGQFIPFLGTALDTKERQAYAATSGAIKDAAIPLFIRGASKTRLLERPGNRLNYAKWRRGYGWVPAGSKARYTEPLGTIKGFRGFAKGLGAAGLILDTPNIVSDIENLKRAVGLSYNHQLLMKE